MMDASASPKSNAEYSEVCGFVLFKNSAFPTSLNQRSYHTVSKYTKLPDFEFDTKVAWPVQTYTIQPRIRRIVTLNDMEEKTSQSLKSEVGAITPKMVAPNLTKRKIVTILEDDENDLHSKNYHLSFKKSASVKSSNKSSGTDFKDEKQLPHRLSSRLSTSSRNSRDAKQNAKINGTHTKKDVPPTKVNIKNKHANATMLSSESTKVRNVKESVRHSKTVNEPLKNRVSKNIRTPRESEKELSNMKAKLIDNLKSEIITAVKSSEKSRLNKSPSQSRNKMSLMKDIKNKNKPVTVIHVPLDEKYQKGNISKHQLCHSGYPLTAELKKVESSTDTQAFIHLKDVKIGTDPLPKTVDEATEMENANLICYLESTHVQTDVSKYNFDSLEIPNVSLKKEKSESKADVVNYHSKSLPNLQTPSYRITLQEEENKASICESSSYIISQATLTYTTKQKINFHVVSSNETSSNQSPSPTPLSYPINMVSVFKTEIKNRELNNIPDGDDTNKRKIKTHLNCMSPLNELKSLNCSYVFNNNKLMKPSDIISTIRVNGLLQNDWSCSQMYCEQFQKELNFIDSFFESLQYLESCSLSQKCIVDDKVDNFVTNTGFTNSSEYGTFLSKLESSANVDDTETIASKSLCLLNLLIRDEQRRAKNLLFVLKMREDALKDFTKSQILWLENKKNQDNIDISTLKKKQRGALLRLQHECGEMHRMRKALLTLSEKRKVGLMKTKKNIELKLKNNVDVEQIILGKKKLKRSVSADRNVAPIKCFDLSSSGCEESTTSRLQSDNALLVPRNRTSITNVASAEKCVQTGDSILETIPIDHATDTAAENFVVVDGGYLNILFHNLSLPQIFSSGKQYEVKEEALKNIVNSSNNQSSNLNHSDVVEKLMDQLKNREQDRSSTPSTARSLVEEFDQYYKGLVEEEDKSRENSPEKEFTKVSEVKDALVQVSNSKLESESCSYQSVCTMASDDTVIGSSNIKIDQSCECDSSNGELQCMKQKDEPVMLIEPGPLPVPVGAPAVTESVVPNVAIWSLSKSADASTSSESSISSQPICSGVSSMASVTSPVHSEAEQLRRQQLAIEREIKALEQQQCQLLVVREIPDKPPPPYTPPIESRIHKSPRVFQIDEATETKITQHITESESSMYDTTDHFDMFVRDFCHESLQRQNSEISDRPWDACNILPQKQTSDPQKLAKKTVLDLKEILTGVQPTVVSGVGARRSDHIDDILFTEWRRIEPEWTALHTDEVVVKNQVFESIFQKILTETVDEYKKTVLNNTD